MESAGPQHLAVYHKVGAVIADSAAALCRYEPWGIVGRQHSPWFDSRFRGCALDATPLFTGLHKDCHAVNLQSTILSKCLIIPESVLERKHMGPI